jgi:hypothetical protein
MIRIRFIQAGTEDKIKLQHRAERRHKPQELENTDTTQRVPRARQREQDSGAICPERKIMSDSCLEPISKIATRESPGMTSGKGGTVIKRGY